MHLIVVKPFNGYSRGDVITDAARVADTLRGEHAHCVVRVAAPTTPGV
jgi:hypothetical protein